MASESVEVEKDPSCTKTEETIEDSNTKRVNQSIGNTQSYEFNFLAESATYEPIAGEVASSHPSNSVQQIAESPTTLTPVMSDVSKDNALQDSLQSIGLEQGDIEFIIEQGEKFIEKPLVLAAKRKISKEKAMIAIEKLKSIKKQQTADPISQRDIEAIESCLKEHPEIDDPVDIALVCEIETDIVEAYFESLPLNNIQKAAIEVKLNAGYSLTDIANTLKLSGKKVRDFIESTFITFQGAEGQKMLGIIQKNFPEIECSNLREMIISKNLKLQDKLCCILLEKNATDCDELKRYFGRFEESKSFFDIASALTIEDISQIRGNSLDNIERLSLQLNKVETLIRNYLEQYQPNSVVREHCTNSQINQIQKIFKIFGNDRITFHMYRMVISNSFEDVIHNAELGEQAPRNVLQELLPLAFYYLKCSLPLDDITHLIANTSKITLTAHDLFHILFQMSDPVLRGYCIEHYSFSNPVPLYFPTLKISDKKELKKFEICKELWYSLQEFSGLVSFGLGRAGWNPIGKSYLLDFIFGTDFVRGNPQTSAFHFNSIDIQMTNNLFGEKDNVSVESTKWAYIDCHGHSNLDVIRVICQHLDIALIHVSYLDYLNNHTSLMKDINHITQSVKHLYLLIRDSESDEMRVEKRATPNQSFTTIFIPNLTKSETKIHSVKKKLKEVGYKILHLEYRVPKYISGEFLENIIASLDPNSLEEIKFDKQLVLKITEYIVNAGKSSHSIGFQFLSYYPIFINYMSCYYRAAIETNQKIVDQHNTELQRITSKLYSTQLGEVVVHFNEILNKENSTLILWKLAQDLSLLSKQVNLEIKTNSEEAVEQKNVKYTLEILWREALLSCRYNKFLDTEQNKFPSLFASNFSNHVERGEVFELIDGDNLRFLNKDIDALLSNLYDRQYNELTKLNKTTMFSMKQAPIVVSIFGPQSSGKSTLLNYCFGCKFLTSAGRCTRGIYGSLSRLSRPINLSNNLLILDTEGLDALERGHIENTSHIHFDRTMVLFCLAVSQAVIINVKGDIGSGMQNLLQVCAYSLNKLKVRKVPAPKIFFVLNQQADPDLNKHTDSINILLKKLNEEAELMDTEGVKISDLIQVSKENLFILPSAFNSEQMNEPGANIFDSNVIKLSPTITFADKCAKLRKAIITQLDVGERAPFKTMSEWMEMSGTIWDTIIRYQDIVKYGNMEEEKCSNMLRGIVSELMKRHIYSHKQVFRGTKEQLILEIKVISTLVHFNITLTQIMYKFDDVFNLYQDRCLTDFDNKCQSDSLLRKMNHICAEAKLNLSRLIYMERKVYEDKFKFHIKAVLAEIEDSESTKNFHEKMDKNVNKYLSLNAQDQKRAFENIWMECSKSDNPRDNDIDQEEIFENLYSIFRMESKCMQNGSKIYELIRKYNFQMDDIINFLRADILAKFEGDPTRTSGTDQFIFPCENNLPIKSMRPYSGNKYYQFFGENSLYDMKKKILWFNKEKLQTKNWVPKKCRPLVKYCSGYYTHPEINWKDLAHNNQILLLASKLRNPNNLQKSSWATLIDMISSRIQNLIQRDPNISPGTVKEMINYLSSLFKQVNYEINYFGAKLTITAERMITTLVFAYAFKSLCDVITNAPLENEAKTKERRASLLQYFLQKIEIRNMVRGTWDREKMNESDLRISNRFALDFIGCVMRGLRTAELPIIEEKFRESRESLSHESILLFANSILTTDEPNEKVMSKYNFVVQYICNRNEEVKKIFQEKWLFVEDKLYDKYLEKMNSEFLKQIENAIQVLRALLDSLKEKCLESTERTAFDSDRNFEIADIESCKESGADMLLKVRESPFKAVMLYLRMYLDPRVSPEEFNIFFSNTFVVNGVQIQNTSTNVLCKNPINPAYVLNEDLFKKLEKTKMFNSENIFNIFEYVTKFLSTLNTYKYQLPRDEFREIVQHIKEEFEKNALGCPSQCPSCGKLCERELHPNDGKCQIKIGHQICSMGGKVWNNDDKRTAVLLMCDDYKDDTRVCISGQNINWGEFKDHYGKDWDWNLPNGDKYVALQEKNCENMRKIWNKYGKEILNYYSTRGTKITFVPYTSFEDPIKYCICFVIDGTSSMITEIKKARISVGQLMSKYQEHESTFLVVIYRDHCDKKVTEIFPNNNTFTPQHKSIQYFLETVKAYGGGDYPEAVLDGLATATTNCEWENSSSVRNIIIHIFDAPPHGDFPNYESHDAKSNVKHCCCCNHGTLCYFDWKRDVWSKMKEFNILYYGINTGKHFPEFEATMKAHLGNLCGEFQSVGKEVVNEAILQIFIDYKKD